MTFAQPKDEALKQAEEIRQSLSRLEGHDFENGLSFENGQLTSTTQETKPQYVFHYRNITSSTVPGSAETHPLMHFGTLKAAYSRAVSQRNLSGGHQITDEVINTDDFRLSTQFDHEANQAYEGEVFFAVKANIQKPFYMPDIGQTQFLRNRAVLYASGLFEEHEVDTLLFDENNEWVENIDELVVERLREQGYDSLSYMNDIEDPGSLSFVILETNQVEFGAEENVQYDGFRYRFGDHGDTKIVEGDKDGNITVKADSFRL